MINSKDIDAPVISRGNRLFKFYALLLLRKIRGSFSLHASLVALLLGGFILLFYVLSIGQLPEFTLGDITGTLLAVTATATLVGASLMFYCLIAGYWARSALESVYPEAARYSLGDRDLNDIIDAPYERIIHGSFVPGSTCFGVLAWLTLAVLFAQDVPRAPYIYELYVALAISLTTLMALILIDWRRFLHAWIRYTLLSLFCSAFTLLTIILVVWQYWPDFFVVVQRATSVAGGHAANGVPSVDRHSIQNIFLDMVDNIWAVGFLVLISVWTIFNIKNVRIFVSLVAKAAYTFLFSERLQRWPDSVARKLVKPFFDEDTLRLMRAKINVTFVFLLMPIFVFVPAYLFASAGNTHTWGMNFFSSAGLFMVMNWLLFSVRSWKGRVSIGMTATSVVLIVLPMFTQNPAFFPKTLVALLGIGNERLATVGLSSKQCAIIESYGVDCFPDSEQTITLSNVNLLDRLGNTVVLELLVKVGGSQSNQVNPEAKVARELSNSAASKAGVYPVTTLTSTLQSGENNVVAEGCDPVLASQLSEGSAKLLRCVELIVPKDQVAGYTVMGRRTYRGGYTVYQSAPAKEPTVIKVTEDSDDRVDSDVGAAIGKNLPDKGKSLPEHHKSDGAVDKKSL